LSPKAGPGRQSFELAKQEIRDRYQLTLDDPDEQLNAGKFYYLIGQSDWALAAFGNVEKLDPQRSTRYFVGCVLAQEGRFAEARQQFSSIPSSDPYYSDAQQMSQAIAGK
jgi:tetratricopeptide (TPR) repeat protein